MEIDSVLHGKVFIRSLWISDWWRFLCRIVGNVVFLAIITLLNTII